MSRYNSLIQLGDSRINILSKYSLVNQKYFVYENMWKTILLLCYQFFFRSQKDAFENGEQYKQLYFSLTMQLAQTDHLLKGCKSVIG